MNYFINKIYQKTHNNLIKFFIFIYLKYTKFFSKFIKKLKILNLHLNNFLNIEFSL